LVIAQPDYKNIPVTRWVSPDGSQPASYASWHSKFSSVGPFQHGRVYGPSTSSGETNRLHGKVEILVNAGLYGDIESALNQYIQDLEAEHWTVLLDTIRQGSPESIRALLQSVSGLAGAVLIGDLPVPWFQMLDDFDQNDTLDGYEYFPCDLFYTDLDGTWADSLHHEKIDGRDTLLPGEDGIYDLHTGDLNPEIWLGRLTASTLGNEKQLVEQYFDKAHRFRLGDVVLNGRALVYVDNDWVPWAWDYDADMDSLYKTRTLVFDPETTIADDYRFRLGENYEWISVFAHSWPGGHGFIYQDTLWSWLKAQEIPAIDPKAFFYNLFACSNCRFVDTSYMGGRYIFAPTFGLAAVGTTKTGSMLDFKKFYDPLGGGKSLGEAFLEWFDQQPLDSIWAQSWYYGMTLLGDPTLKPAVRAAIEEPGATRALVEGFAGARPNPFRSRLGIHYALPKPGWTNLTIYDPAGKLVKVLVRSRQASGSYRVEWDGCNEQGSAVPSGVYFYRLASDSFNRVEKIIKIK
jgi:hypothetical protein